MNMNKASLIGYLDANPVAKVPSKGGAFTAIEVVTSEDDSPMATDEVVLTSTPHLVIAYGKLGTIMAKYLKAGDRVYVEGHLETLQTQTSKGVKQAKVIVATQLIMLGGRKATK